MSMGARICIWVVMAVTPAIGLGACGAANTVRDWGLHTAWAVERDCDHPERPAMLVGVPWNTEFAAPAPAVVRESAARPAPEVRSGMRVTLWRQGENADICLHGTAMGTARAGESVAVRAGLGGATLHGIVRGPGLVELLPRTGGN